MVFSSARIAVALNSLSPRCVPESEAQMDKILKNRTLTAQDSVIHAANDRQRVSTSGRTKREATQQNGADKAGQTRAFYCLLCRISRPA